MVAEPQIVKEIVVFNMHHCYAERRMMKFLEPTGTDRKDYRIIRTVELEPLLVEREIYCILLPRMDKTFSTRSGSSNI